MAVHGHHPHRFLGLRAPLPQGECREPVGGATRHSVRKREAGTLGRETRPVVGNVANVLILWSRYMSCSFCRRRGKSERATRGWKVFGGAVYCLQCRHTRYRLRSITMTLVEPAGSARRVLRAALEGLWISAAPHDRIWEARISEGQPVVRVLIRNRWWELGLKGSGSPAQRFAYEQLASGAAAAGELFFLAVRRDDTQLRNGSESDPNAHSEIKCRMVAWVPRDQTEAQGHRAEPQQHATKEHNRRCCFAVLLVPALDRASRIAEITSWR